MPSLDPRHRQVVGLIRKDDPKTAKVVDDLLSLPEGPYVMDSVLATRSSNVTPTDYYTARFLVEDFLTRMRYAVPGPMQSAIDAAMMTMTPLYATSGGETKRRSFGGDVIQSAQMMALSQLQYGTPDAARAKQIKAARAMNKQKPMVAKMMDSWMYRAVSMTAWNYMVFQQTESPAMSMFVSMFVRPKVEQAIYGKVMGHLAQAHETGMVDQGREFGFQRSYTPKQFSDQILPSITNKARALVNQMSSGAEKTLQQSMTRAVQQGWTEKRASKWYSETYGMDQRSEQALANFEKMLIGQEVPFGRREALLRDKAAQLRAQRADLLAETELFTSMNAGRSMVISDAVRSGRLPSDVRRVWVTADDERVCPWCGPMNNVRIPTQEMWTLPNGRVVADPPAHPRCRCVVLPGLPAPPKNYKLRRPTKASVTIREVKELLMARR